MDRRISGRLLPCCAIAPVGGPATHTDSARRWAAAASLLTPALLTLLLSKLAQHSSCVQVPEVKVEHLQQHFVDYVRNDNLGQISSWLLAHADRDGADCKACDRLAQLHSIAVDFSKTGIPASMGPDERRLLVRSNLVALSALQWCHVYYALLQFSSEVFVETCPSMGWPC